MDKVKVKCALCGAEKMVSAKPEPKNAREKKEIYWRCSCGAVALRDGISIYRRGKPPEADAGIKPKPEPARQDAPAAPLVEKESRLPLAPLFSLAGIIGVAMFTLAAARKKKPVEAKLPQAPGKSEVNYFGPVL